MRFAESVEDGSGSAACPLRQRAQTRRGSLGVAGVGNEREICTALYCGRGSSEMCPKLTDASMQAQQATGIAALTRIATQAHMAMSEAPTVIFPRVPDLVTADASSRHTRDLATSQTATGSERGPLRKLQARLQTDHLSAQLPVPHAEFRSASRAGLHILGHSGAALHY